MPISATSGARCGQNAASNKSTAVNAAKFAMSKLTNFVVKAPLLHRAKGGFWTTALGVAITRFCMPAATDRHAKARLKYLHSSCGRVQVLACALLWIWSGAVSAAPEANRSLERAPSQEARATGQPDLSQGNAEKPPLQVRIVQSPDEAASAERRERDSHEREREDLKAQIRSALAAEKQVALTRWAVGISIIGTLGLFCTLWLTRQSVREATRAADAANDNAASLIDAERAYVTLSILDPGVQWRPNDERQFFVKVRAKNFGRTPATVTHIRLHANIREHGDLLPVEFPYQEDEGTVHRTGFLVPVDDFVFDRNFPLAPSQPRRDSSRRLWIFGHVDYMTLGRRYRYGFACQYEPCLDGGARNVMPAAESRYDFDRQRVQGEGNDW